MALTYAIVDGFSIAFLLILFIGTREKSSRLTETRCFRFIVVLTVVALLSDLIAWQLDGRAGAANRTALWCVNGLCYGLSGVLGLLWLNYTGLKLGMSGRVRPLVRVLVCAPACALAALAVSSPFNGLLFTLDAQNVYQRGPLLIVQVAVPMCYMLAAAIWALHYARRERLRQRRSEYLSLASFILFPLAGSLMQALFYGVSLSWPCAGLSLMMVYVSMQNQRISLDALTGLNNRGQLDRYLYACFERADAEPGFTLLMLDIDDFKKINDEQGHIAGDAALIDAAGVLTRALADTGAFIARYGGDEFAAVLPFVQPARVMSIIAAISDEAERHNTLNQKPRPLMFSVGYACYDSARFANYQDMITAADARMYIQKRQHKLSRG